MYFYCRHQVFNDFCQHLFSSRPEKFVSNFFATVLCSLSDSFLSCPVLNALHMSNMFVSGTKRPRVYTYSVYSLTLYSTTQSSLFRGMKLEINVFQGLVVLDTSMLPTSIKHLVDRQRPTVPCLPVKWTVVQCYVSCDLQNS